LTYQKHQIVSSSAIPELKWGMLSSTGPILIVEDVAYILELLEATLRLKGFDVVSARNGEEALSKIAETRPTLILTDLLMPEMDGFALAQKIRRDPTTQDIPIIFISATYVTEEDRQFALSLGAVRFLEKPVEANELLLTVAEVLTETHEPWPEPLDDETFQAGYRERLEHKLREKQLQVERAQRLVDNVSPDQKESFQDILALTKAQRDKIANELRSLDEPREE
jgi:CheY-like chemotaxis protein